MPQLLNLWPTPSATRVYRNIRINKYNIFLTWPQALFDLIWTWVQHNPLHSVTMESRVRVMFEANFPFELTSSFHSHAYRSRRYVPLVGPYCECAEATIDHGLWIIKALKIKGVLREVNVYVLWWKISHVKICLPHSNTRWFFIERKVFRIKQPAPHFN